MQLSTGLPFVVRRWLILLCAALAFVSGAALHNVPGAAAFTVTRQWTGLGANGNWTNPANWGGTAPLAGEILLFPPGPLRLDTLNDFPANTNFQEIAVTGPGYILAGNAANLTTGLTTSHATGNVTANLVIAGPGAVTNNANGRLILAGANTFSGEVAVNQGVVRVRDGSALGSLAGATFVADTSRLDGGLEFEGSFTSPEEITLASSTHAVFHQVSGDAVLSGDLHLPPLLADIDILTNTALTITGDVLGGRLIRQGGGHLTLNGNVNGGLDLNTGLTTVNGPVADRITLAGNATFNGTGSTPQIIATGGLFAPGANAPGMFTVNGTVQLDSMTQFGVIITGANFSQLVTSGRPGLGAAVLVSDVENAPPPPQGSVAMILKNNSAQSVLGTFNNLPEGAVYSSDGVDFRISYIGGDGNDVTLTVLDSIAADLRVTVSTSPEPVAPGGVFTYTIVVTNDGPSDAESVQLLAPVTEGVSFVSALVPADWTCTVPFGGSTGQLRCSRSTLASGEAATFALTVRVDNARTAEIAPRIVVLSSTPDPLTFNNQAQAVTHVSGEPVSSLPFKRVLPFVSRDPG